jgi:hypothetical protein
MNAVIASLHISATFLVALGTLVLAGFTGFLAFSTRALARSSEIDQRSQWRPILIPGNPEVEERGDGELRIQVRNVGRGPALGVHGELRSGVAPCGASIPGQPNIAAPSESVAIRFSLNPSPFPAGRVITICISYHDIGEQWHQTEIKAASQRESEGTLLRRLARTSVEETGRYLTAGQGSRRATVAAERHARLPWIRAWAGVQSLQGRLSGNR